MHVCVPLCKSEFCLLFMGFLKWTKLIPPNSLRNPITTADIFSLLLTFILFFVFKAFLNQLIQNLDPFAAFPYTVSSPVKSCLFSRQCFCSVVTTCSLMVCLFKQKVLSELQPMRLSSFGLLVVLFFFPTTMQEFYVQPSLVALQSRL